MKHSANQFNIPEHVSRVTDMLLSNGFQAYLVGGCVRDLVMDKTPKDWDITTNAKPEQIISTFTLTPNLSPEGREEPNIPLKVVYENTFGTVMIIDEEAPLDSSTRQIEITPYRSETTYSDNRHPDSVSFSDTIEEDLKRRDFTMNALALDCSKRHQKDTQNQNDIINDMFHGLNDISKRQIVCVGNPTERLTEDALRIMRAIRFSAQLGFAVSHETMEAMFHVKHLLKNISIERIRDEFVKIINSPNPIIGIGLMVKLGIMEFVIPELLEGIDCEQGGAHKYDVFEHLLHACQHAADKGFPFHVKLAALFHDIGKPKTRRPGTKKAYTFYGHEVVGARMAEKIMQRMKFPKADTDMVVKLVRNHMFFSDTEQITLSAVRRIVQKMSPSSRPEAAGAPQGKLDDLQNHPIWDLMKIRECDRVGMNKTEAPYRLRKYFAMIEEALRDPISVSQLAIDGNFLINTLSVKPGRRMGWILHALLEEVLEDPTKNTIETLSDRVKHLETLDDLELRDLGEKGKEKKEELEEEEVGKLHVKHGVGIKKK